MKFLVLALCVCAAAAAPQQRVFKPWQQAKAVPQAVAQPWQKSQVVAQAVVQPAVVRSSIPVAAKQYSGNEHEAVVLRSESDVKPDGFNYVYETGNGISAQAVGSLKKVDNQDVIVSQGSYQYTAPDGTPVQLTYVADENGYQPQSNLLPVGPAIPAAILRSLEYIAAHPAPADTVVVGRKY